MALTPMDLQMLFAQADKIGKEVADEREGVMLRNAMEDDARARVNGDRVTSVKATESHEGLKSIRGDERRRRGKRREEPSSAPLLAYGEREAASDEGGSLRDPNLGVYVDLTG
jgi:hypothetical protein